MSVPIEPFECHWRPSRRLLALCLSVQGLALPLLLSSSLPGWLQLAALSLVALQMAWQLPRRILLVHPRSFTALRHDADGWQLYSAAEGWVPVQLRPGCLALPLAVVLRYRRAGQRLEHGLCIAADALPADQHRRLRVRLKHARRRWAAPAQGAA